MQGSCAWIQGRIDCKPSHIQGSFFATNLKNVLLRANPSKFPYVCIVWSAPLPQTMGHYSTSSLKIFCPFVCFQVATFWRLGAPQDQSHLSRFYKNCRRVDPSTNQKGNQVRHFFGKFPRPKKLIRGPDFEVYQDDGFFWIFCMVHPHRLSWGDWKLILPVWSVCVIQVTRIFTSSKFTVQK